MTSTYSRLLFGLLALLPTALAAQVGPNIIPNGSFEEYAATAAARRHQVRADSEASNEDGDENEGGDDENDKPSGDFDPYAKPLYWYITHHSSRRVSPTHTRENLPSSSIRTVARFSRATRNSIPITSRWKLELSTV